MIYRCVFGDSYILFTGRDENNIPARAYPLRPDRVTHLYHNGELRGFVYVPVGGTYERDGITMLAADVMHVKFPNPGDPYGGLGKGLSPMCALAHSGDVDNAATAFLKMFFDQGAMPPAVLKTELTLNSDDVSEVQERWMSIYGNWRNWQEPAVLDRDLDYQRIGLTFDELGMADLDARNENRMAMVFGVPLSLIESRPGISQSTYSNVSTELLSFWQNRLKPELTDFEVEYQYYLQGTNGEFVAYDYSTVDALQPVRSARAEEIRLAWEAGAAQRGEYRAALSLPVDPLVDSVYKLQLSTLLLPASAAPELPETGAASSEDEDEEQPNKALPGKKKGLTFAQKDALYKLIDRTANAWEGRFVEVGTKAFSEDERMVKALAGELQKQAYQERKAVDWNLLMPSVDGYYADGGLSQEQWARRFRPVFAGVITAQTTQMAAQFGLSFDLRNLFALSWYDTYVMKFAQEIAATSSATINELLQKAMFDGWTIPEMQEQLTILFDAWAGDLTDAQRSAWALDRLPPNRTELIARDQTLRASNAGTNALYNEWGVRKKEWWATPDSRTRPAHRVGAAFGQEPLVVAMNEPFRIGNSLLMYPGDPNGELADVIQCRCSSLPVIEAGEIVGE